MLVSSTILLVMVAIIVYLRRYKNKEKPQFFISFIDVPYRFPSFECELWTKKDKVDIKIKNIWHISLKTRSGPNGKLIKDWALRGGWDSTYLSDRKVADMLRPMKSQLSESLLFHSEEKVRNVMALLFKEETIESDEKQ